MPEVRRIADLAYGAGARVYVGSVTVCPAPGARCPTVSFRVRGQSPADTARLLGDRGVCVLAGDYYAYEYFTAAGLRDSGGAVREGSAGGAEDPALVR